MAKAQIQIPKAYRPPPRGQRFFARAAGARFDARAAGQATQIDLFDEIGQWGVSASDFRDQLRSAGDVVLRLNSPGGDVFDGITIFNMLAQHPGDVRVEIIGVAASAASVIAMAGDTIAIAANAHVMIHGAWALCIGNATDHTETAALLNQIDQSLAATYAERTGQPVADIAKAMTAESWFTGQDAIDAGFADELLGAAEATAKFDLGAYAHAPADLSQSANVAIDIAGPVALEKLLRSAGLSRRQANRVALNGWAGLSNGTIPETPDELKALSEIVAKATAEMRRNS